MITSVEELKRAVSANGQKWGKAGKIINQFRPLRTMQKTAQDFYDMKYEIKILEGYQPIKLPIARQLVETLVAHLPLTNPVVEVIPFKDTTAYYAKAINQQEFFQALLQHSLAQSEPAILLAANDIGRRGEAFIKTVYDFDLVNNGLKKDDKESDEDYKLRKQSYLIERMPLVLTCPDPMNCHPFSGHVDCHPVEMIEVYNIYAGELRRMFPDWKSSKKDTDTGVLIEYWNAKKYCYLAEGVALTNGFEDNPFGFVPYTHVYSGWGARTDDNLPEHKAVSMIFAAENAIKELSRYRAYLDKALAFSSMPVLHTEKEQNEYPEGGLKIHPGMVLYGGEKVDISWMAANLPAGILQAIMLGQSEINKAQPAVLRGEAPRGIEAGYPMALMIGEARLQFGVALENLKTLIGRALEQVRYLIRDVTEEELAMWGESKALTLSREDCQGAFRIKVDFDATTPETRAVRAKVGSDLRAAGSISHYTELKVWQNNKNPEEEMDRMTVEGIMKHPAIQRYIATRALLKKGEKEAAVLVEQAMSEGEEGAIRKAESSGIPLGGRPERKIPEDIIAQALSKRGKALRAEPTEG